MLQIKNVRKKYVTGDFEQIALNDLSLALRDNEFVAILGPSGSGKTTLLNIIGGLDRYDSGDLVIDGVSTRKYKDRDWDSYRNHTIGFVFQSYNLIPHQTVLSNVELALTIGGISKSEREKRAMDALEKVGLKEQAHKRPNQMSGGQMQRVAIARALVNDPKILLADEPTGALDSVTSVQVMELLKEVAKDRLVVMVTHNGELAEEYANRIVRIKDGVMVDDSNPLIIEDDVPAVHKNLGHAAMSLLTAFGLSLNNLMTKKGRTILTAFAGSIGIIGISLILSLSTGFQNYIDDIQEDTMTSYPLSIEAETTDFLSAILAMHSEDQEEPGENELVEQQYIQTAMNSIARNDLRYFKKYLEDHEEEYSDYLTRIKYSYSVAPTIYTIDSADNMARINPDNTMSSYMGTTNSMMSYYNSMSGTFTEISDPDSLSDNYELLAGDWPHKYNEMLAVVSDPHQISDLLLYSLGFKNTKELNKLIATVMSGEKAEKEDDPITITYDDLMNLELKLVDPSDTYKYNEEYGIYEDMSEDREYMDKVYENSEDLKIVGIAYMPDSESSVMAGVLYLPDLTRYVIDKAGESEIVKKQLADKDTDVFSGKRFDDESEESGLDFGDMISVDENMIASAFQTNVDMGALSGLGGGVGIDENTMAQIIMGSAAEVASNLESVTQGVVSGITTADAAISTAMIQGYLAAYTRPVQISETETGYFLILNDGGSSTAEQYKNTVMTDATFEAMADQGGDIKLNPANIKKIAIDALNSYVGGLTPDENGMVPAASLPEPSSAAQTAVSQNSALIFEEGTKLAQDYTTGLVAQGIGSAVSATMEPVMSGVADTLSGIAKIFSGNILSVDQDKFAQAFKFDMEEDELSRLMSSMMTGKSATYSNNLLALGYQDLDEPTRISFYFKDFETKGLFKDWLEAYNDAAEEDHKLTYSDLTGLLMGSVETIINGVTYVLIAFVSISLIVSSIMIGIITYISVLERTKEIGILRAIGASKRNISSIFNAETFIIGFLAGLIGVGVTYILNIPINAILHHFIGNENITAVLLPVPAAALVVISTLLTMIGGLIPSRSASKKDPVIALRSE